MCQIPVCVQWYIIWDPIGKFNYHQYFQLHVHNIHVILLLYTYIIYMYTVLLYVLLYFWSRVAITLLLFILLLLLQCIRSVLLNKIISSDKDVVGVVFFGTVSNYQCRIGPKTQILYQLTLAKCTIEHQSIISMRVVTLSHFCR